MPGRSTTVTVEYNGVAGSAITVPVVQSDPGIFGISPSVALGQGAILNQDGTVNSATNPAAPGSVISIFGTGAGLIDPLPDDGEIIQDTSHLTRLPVTVIFSGPATGEVLYAGAAPTLVAGAIQINVRLPETFPEFAPTLPKDIGILVRIGEGLLSSVLATVAVK